MKKIFTLVMALFLLATGFIYSFASGSDVTDFPHKTEDFIVRDPNILAHDGYYYMYGTGLATAPGYGCRVSKDLENWSDPYNVFVAGDGFDGVADFWAPECHYYNGSFYLFATYRSATTGYRGTSVFRSDDPMGPFAEISDGHATPHNSDNIDGTLYIDKEGCPWMVYVSEWTATDDGVGRMSAARLSDDLSSFISEPIELFRADDAPWASTVTDGPFLYRTNKGSLIMLWSTGSHEGYCVGIARSCNGEIDGRWTQEFTRVYSRAFYLNPDKAFDGGHPTLFETFDGRLMMSMHAPNSSYGEGEDRVFEHCVFYEMEEKCDTLRIVDFYCFNRFFDWITTLFNRISDVFEFIFGL